MLLADFHVHSTWSDGRLPIPEIVDVFGRTGHDVIAITDHVVKKTHSSERSRTAAGSRSRSDNLDAYRAEIERETKRAWDEYRMVVLPGVELTRNALTGKRVGPRPRARTSTASSPPTDRRGDAHAGPGGRRHHRGVPSERAVGLVREHVLSLEQRREELAELVDLWELACRWDLFPPGLPRAPPVPRQQRFPRPAAPLRVEDAHELRKSPDAILASLRAGQGLGVTRLPDPLQSPPASERDRAAPPVHGHPRLHPAGDRVRTP